MSILLECESTKYLSQSIEMHATQIPLSRMASYIRMNTKTIIQNVYKENI